MGDGHRLDRRDVLAGLGALGIGLGAGALGFDTTRAVLTDTESFVGNVITAGTLEIDVGYAVVYDPIDGPPRAASGTVDDASPAGVEFDALSPGDRGRLDLCPSLPHGSNPGYLWLCGELAYSPVDAPPDDAPPVDELAVPATDANLGEALRARLRYAPRGETDDALWCPGTDDVDGVILEGSFVQVLEQLSAGVPLDPSGRVGVSAGNQDCVAPDDPTPCLRLEWCLPEDAGNTVTNDRLSYELVLHAEQCRHADGTRSPCAPRDTARHGISFVAFCTDTDDDFEVDLTWNDADLEDGDLTAVDWEVTEGDPTIETVVLYYATTFENFDYDNAPTSGTVAVGEGDATVDWPPGGTTTTGQSPSDPCPNGGTGVKYEWNDTEEVFERA